MCSRIAAIAVGRWVLGMEPHSITSMEIKKINVLAGPSIWTNFKAIEAWVDIGKFEDFPSHTIPGFPERLMTWLPSIIEHRCGIGERGGFFQRLVTGTYLGHILEHVTLELQSLAGLKADYGRARETSDRGVYKVVIEFIEPEVAIHAMQCARSLILAAVEDQPYDVSAAIKSIRALADQVCLGPGTGSIVKAAHERGIPSIRLNSGSLVQLGYCSAQKRIWTAETDHTSAVAESVAQDKQLTAQLLKSVGVPVPYGKLVETADDACTFAESEGYPVVVKPIDGNHGRGVFVNLQDSHAIRSAFDSASKEGSAVVVEVMVPGVQHRVLVVGERVIAVGRADPDLVVGDGHSSVRELISKANEDPRRGGDGVYPLSVLGLEEITLRLLAQQSLAPDSVPATGQQVVLNYNGDCVVDVTDEIHPEIAEQCVLAAQTVGLNIAGIDLIVPDISKPMNAQKGAIIEVNASPSLVMHVQPLRGTPRPVGAAIISGLFDTNASGRVPLVAVSGTNGKTSTLDLLEQILIVAGQKPGVANSDSVRANGRVLATGDSANFDGARSILVNPFVDSAILEISAPSVLSHGLAFDECNVAIVTNLGSGDHMGAQYVETLDVIAKAERCAVDVVGQSGTAVLNADDPAVVEFAQYSPGRVIYFSRALQSSQISDLLKGGALVIAPEGAHIVAASSNQRVPLVPLDAVPYRLDRSSNHWQLENALASIAAAYSLGVAPSHMEAGLLQASAHARPRLSAISLNRGHVVISLCRNPSAVAATLDFARGLKSHRVRALMHLFKDQTQSSAAQQGELLGAFCDEIACSTDCSQPVLSSFGEAVKANQSRKPCSVAAVEIHEFEPLSRSWIQNLNPGELLLLQARDSVEFGRLLLIAAGAGGQALNSGPTLPMHKPYGEHESNPYPSSSKDI